MNDVGFGPYPEQLQRQGSLKKALNSAFDRAAQSQEAAKAAQVTPDPRPANEGAGAADLTYDLTQSGPLRLGAGFGFLFRRLGSQPGARLDVNIGGKVQSIYPGTTFTGPFNDGEVSRSSDSAQVGTALLTVFRRPDVRITEPQDTQSSSAVASNGDGEVLGVSAGAPTLVTEGMALAGVTGVLAMVDAGGGATITAGALDWYRWDDTLQAWFLLFQAQLPTGARRVAVPEERITTPYGRIAARPNGVTTSMSGTTVTVYLRGSRS